MDHNRWRQPSWRRTALSALSVQTAAKVLTEVTAFTWGRIAGWAQHLRDGGSACFSGSCMQTCHVYGGRWRHKPQHLLSLCSEHVRWPLRGGVCSPVFVITAFVPHGAAILGRERSSTAHTLRMLRSSHNAFWTARPMAVCPAVHHGWLCTVLVFKVDVRILWLFITKPQ